MTVPKIEPCSLLALGLVPLLGRAVSASQKRIVPIGGVLFISWLPVRPSLIPYLPLCLLFLSAISSSTASSYLRDFEPASSLLYTQSSGREVSSDVVGTTVFQVQSMRLLLILPALFIGGVAANAGKIREPRSISLLYPLSLCVRISSNFALTISAFSFLI